MSANIPLHQAPESPGFSRGEDVNWIQTRSGTRFDLLDPRPEMIDIGDIIHALSHLCRFTGHVSRFMSVAEHSVMVSNLVPAQDALAGLLHDATEAYVADVADVARPLKQLLPDYKVIEDRIWLVIAERFSLDPQLPASVKEADNISLMWERRDLLAGSADAWREWGPEHLIVRVPEQPVKGLDPEAAATAFRQRFAELTN